MCIQSFFFFYYDSCSPKIKFVLHKRSLSYIIQENFNLRWARNKLAKIRDLLSKNETLCCKCCE